MTLDYERDYRAPRMTEHDRLKHYWLSEDLRHDGENRLGIEFKHNTYFRQYQSFFIETAEKAHPRDGDYVPSGVYRDDNTWLWVMGDYDGVFIVAKADLLAEVESGLWPIKPNRFGTSLGIRLPISRIRELRHRALGDVA